MKKTIIALFLALCCAVAFTQEIPRPVKRMMFQEEKLNNICRDASGVVPACAERDNLLKEIESRGWTWGHDGEPSYLRTWEPKPKPIVSTVLSQGLTIVNPHTLPSDFRWYAVKNGLPGTLNANGDFIPFECDSSVASCDQVQVVDAVQIPNDIEPPTPVVSIYTNPPLTRLGCTDKRRVLLTTEDGKSLCVLFR